MTKLDDFSKIIVGGNEISKVYHLRQEIWSSVNAPGPSTLIAGNMEAGFYGEVPASEFFTATELGNALGFIVGTVINNDTPWLKFILDGKTVFIPKKPIRHSVGKHQLEDAQVVEGNKTVSKNGKIYKVRLIKGTNASTKNVNQYLGAINHNSEWNRLMLPIVDKAKSKIWDYPNNVGTVENWNINYTDEDLGGTNAGLGYYCYVYENYNGNTMIRGGDNGIEFSSYTAQNQINNMNGWRPVLELVE